MQDKLVVNPLVLPVLMMLLWTFLVLLSSLWLRIQVIIRSKSIDPYFETFHGKPPSARMVQWKNHLQNLFEIPVLYYVLLLLQIAQSWDDHSIVILA